MKKVLLSAAILISAGSVFAQSKFVNKAFNEVKVENPNFDEARSLINQALENPETKDQAKTWYVAGFVENKIFEAERNKQFIGKQPDQVKMYEALVKTYDYYTKAFELDNMPNEKGKVKPKYSKDIQTTLRNNLNYLVNAGSYYYDSKNYQGSYDMFDKFTTYGSNDNFKPETQTPATDSLNLQIMFYKGIAASLIPNSQLAIASYENMKGKNYQELEVYKYLSTEYLNIKDSANFAKVLEEGAIKFPEDPYFSQTLINVYLNNEDYDKAMVYINEAIRQEPNQAQFYDLKGKILEFKKDIPAALENYKKATEIDPGYADAWANIGVLYYNAAVEEQDKATQIKDTKAYNKAMADVVRPKYQEALPYMQKAQALNPENREYLVALRSIYYNLRMSEEFEKIEAIINQ